MIFKTNNIMNNKMTLINESSRPEEDFEYLGKYSPRTYTEDDFMEQVNINGSNFSKVKAYGEYFIAGRIKDTDGAYKRNNASLLSRTLLVIDIDNTPMSLEELREHIKSILGDYSYLIYPTASHCDSKTKVRLVVLPEKEMDEREYKSTLKEVQVKLAIEIDDASFTWSQLMGLPLTYMGREEEFKVMTNYGMAYPIVDAGEVNKNRKAKNKSIPQGKRNNTLFNHGIKLYKKGVDEDIIYQQLIEMNELQCEPPTSEGEVLRIFESIIRYNRDDSTRLQNGNIRISDGVYKKITLSNGGESIKPISNFILEPIKIVEYVDDRSKDFIDLKINIKGESPEYRKINVLSFENINNFKESISSIKTSFTGSKDDLQYIKVLLNEQSIDRTKAYSCGGVYKIDEEWQFVTETGSINSIGKLNSRIINCNPNGIHTNIFDNSPITKEELEIIAEDIFRFNAREVSIPILAYISGLALKEKLHIVNGKKFPHLIISGEAGSGKSATSKNIIIAMIGYKSEPHAASGITKFTADKYISSNNTVPFIIEEYKPSYLKTQTSNDISNIARSAYDKHGHSRGNKDRSIESDNLSAPLIIIGESGFSETAIIERSIILTMSKKETQKYTESFNKLIKTDYLSRLGRTIFQEGLKLPEQELINRFNYYSEIVSTTGKIKADRVKDNIVILLLGLSILWDIYESFDLSFEKSIGCTQDVVIDLLINNAIEENFGSFNDTMSNVDKTLELMATAYSYYHNQDMDHSVLVKTIDGREVLALKLKKLHVMLSKFMKDYSRNEKYLELSDISRQLKHTDYFISINGKNTHKINITVNNKETSGSYTLIDKEKAIEKGLDIEDFLRRR